jgi:hypothetical protein
MEKARRGRRALFSILYLLFKDSRLSIIPMPTIFSVEMAERVGDKNYFDGARA